MKYVFGAEGGGTKTTGAIADLSGKILSQFTGGPSNFLIIGVEKAAENILSVLEECLKLANLKIDEISCLMFGLTGAGRKSDQDKMRNGFIDYVKAKGISFEKILVDSDARISLEGAFPGKPGMIIISGTGSIMFGKTSDGILNRVGGWGRTIGDEGSGYYIGKEGLKYAVQAIDGRVKNNLLFELISERFNLNSLESIIAAVYKENFDIATIAPLVFEAAEKGDEYAKKILDNAASDLFLHVSTMVAKLNVKEKIGLAFVGSVLTNDTIIRKNLINRIQKELPMIIIQNPEKEAIDGAVIMAINYLNQN
jgi:N-acetylglucosamine kinase-like BadF-type ATPase